MLNVLTAKDIMSLFCMGKNQAYALMHSAGFPTIEINGRMYVEESALKEWLNTYKGKRYEF